MGDITRHDKPGLLALLMEDLKQGLDRNAVGVHADHGVAGLVVAAKRCSSSSRIRNVVAGRMGVDDTDVWELGEHHFLARGQHACIYLRQGCSIADEVDDIQGFGWFLGFFLLVAASGEQTQHDKGEEG